MTLQETKEQLRRCRWLEREYQRVDEEARRWQKRQERCGQSGAQPAGGLQARIQKLEEHLRQTAAQLLEERGRLQARIASVPDPTLRLLLEYHYIDGMTLEQVAEHLHYSYVHTCRLHKQALAGLSREQTERRAAG